MGEGLGFSTIRGTVAGAVALFVAGGAVAEPRDKPPMAETEMALHDPLPREEVPTGPGVRAGSFVLFPVLGLGETFDDNIFASRDDRKADFVRTVSPALIAVTEGKDRFARLQIGAEAGLYKWHSSENYFDGHLSAESRMSLSAATQIFGGAWAGRDHEERESPNEVFGREPTRYFDLRGYGGVRHRMENLTLTAGGRVERLDFRDTSAAGGAINNDDRDRNILGGGVQASYALMDGFEPFIQAGLIARRYDDARDDNGFARDSTGMRFLAGARFRPAPNILAQAFAGLMIQNYDDARLKDIRRPALGASLNWTLAPETRLGAILDRALDETTLSGASGIVDTTAALFLRHGFTDRIAANLRLGLTRSEFPGAGRVDDLAFVGGTVSWRINSRFYLIGEYTWTGQTSTADGEAYRRNRVLLGLEGRF
ncbi:MAG: hypothetical protein FJX37_05465 [Alphaproteobacteria bacterium]|nr:hypothetical protein [Alphaproteobacteria bacterium]MBM3951963.1 hypothetical protein [Rhodospirillales bacterium]